MHRSLWRSYERSGMVGRATQASGGSCPAPLDAAVMHHCPAPHHPPWGQVFGHDLPLAAVVALGKSLDIDGLLTALFGAPQ